MKLKPKRSTSRLCVAYDHRLLDGVITARFLGEVKRGLEDSQPLFSEKR